MAGLTQSQIAAVTTLNGPVLVIAGAGSGKTKTIVHRVAYLIQKGIKPDAILLLTFTRKSAQEMLRRAAGLIDNRARRVSGGTFHSFAHDCLRRHATLLGFSEQFSILDRSDSEGLIGQVRKQYGPPSQTQRFPQKGTLASIIGKAVNQAKTIEQILIDDYPHFRHLANEIETIAVQYQLKKQASNVMDYDDLLTKLLRLLDDHDDVLAFYQRQFSHIMVDEYQDTNPIQASIIQLLSGTHQNVFVVGDDAQSIYSFRGASFQNIMQFPNQFPTAKTIILSQNFRSTQPILNLTNAVISQAKEQYKKTLVSDIIGTEKPVYIETPDDNTQSQFVCQKILEFREEGIELGEMAILFRSGWHSNDIEIELNAANLPFVKYGGIKFVEAAHIKDIMAFARVMGNRSDNLSWLRILQLVDGIGPKTADQLAQTFQSPGPIGEIKGLLKGKKYEETLTKIVRLINQPNEGKTPSQLLDDIFEIYRPIFELKYDDYAKRFPDIESLKTIAERYANLTQFLAEISLDPPDSTQIDAVAETESESKLTLSTIHSAKGLEWKVVFVISLIDGYLPSFQSLNRSEDIEEERRLLYVALTRAKRHLFILKPNLDISMPGAYGYGGRQFSKVSRFLEGDVLAQNTDRWALVEDASSATLNLADSEAAGMFDSEFSADTNRSKKRKYYF